MVYTVNKTLTIEVEDARSSLEFLVHDWTNKAINDNSSAIKEVRALESTAYQQMRGRLISAIRPVLPEVNDHATTIIEGLLNLDGKPYHEYLRPYFRNVLGDIAHTMISSKLDDVYQPVMAGFLRDEIKHGKLGDYFFYLSDLSLEVEKQSAIAINVKAGSRLLAKVVLSNDKSVLDVEKDEVGLNAHLAEINPRYHRYLSRLILSNNLKRQYLGIIKGHFRPNAHSKAIAKVTEIINLYAGNSRKKAA